MEVNPGEFEQTRQALTSRQEKLTRISTFAASSVWFLSLIGVFITLTLTYGHYAHLSLPCGRVQGGCDRIATDPRSMAFGLPVAIYGLAAYVALAILASGRLLLGSLSSGPSSKISSAIAYTGLGVSVYYTMLARFTIHAVCVWCTASAVTMSLIAVAHAILALNSDMLPLRAAQKLVSGGVCGLLSLCLLGVSRLERPLVGPRYDRLAFETLSRADLIPPDSLIVGPPNAKTTMVLFVDGECGACARAFTAARALIRSRTDFDLVVRHHPLPEHATAFADAVACEVARDGNNFWPFLDALFDPYRSATAWDTLAKFGYSTTMFERRLNDPSDPARERAERDKLLSERLRIVGTPLIVLVTGNRARPLKSVEVESVLSAGKGDDEEFQLRSR
jgi:uncharacterized membrane protein